MSGVDPTFTQLKSMWRQPTFNQGEGMKSEQDTSKKPLAQPIDPNYAQTFELFSRLSAWNFQSTEEPNYSFVIVMTQYWNEHGTKLEKMFLQRLMTLWEDRLRVHASASYHHKFANYTKNIPSFVEYQAQLHGVWKTRHEHHLIFLRVLYDGNWKCETPLPDSQTPPS